MKLEVGSGTRPRAGYKHLDINPDMPDLDYVAELDQVPEPDGTFEEVVSIHSIEHVSIDRAQSALSEWFRVLKPGGRCHVDTPNIERNVTLFLRGGWENDFRKLTADEQAYCSVDGVPNAARWLNFKCFSSHHKYDVHYWNATPSLLSKMFELAGFVEVRVKQCEPSLIVEGYKP